jgi:hypothetical protein
VIDEFRWFFHSPLGEDSIRSCSQSTYAHISCKYPPHIEKALSPNPALPKDIHSSSHCKMLDEYLQYVQEVYHSIAICRNSQLIF